MDILIAAQRIGVNRRGIAPPEPAEPEKIDARTVQRSFGPRYSTSGSTPCWAAACWGRPASWGPFWQELGALPPVDVGLAWVVCLRFKPKTISQTPQIAITTPVTRVCVPCAAGRCRPCELLDPYMNHSAMRSAAATRKMKPPATSPLLRLATLTRTPAPLCPNFGA